MSGIEGTRIKLALTELTRIDLVRLILVDRVEQLPEPINSNSLSAITRSGSM
jgi:hypothetical protein